MEATLHNQSLMSQLPRLGEVFAVEEVQTLNEILDGDTLQNPELEWQAAIASLSDLLKSLTRTVANGDAHDTSICRDCGIIISGPVPVFSDLSVFAHFNPLIFTSARCISQKFRLPPAPGKSSALESPFPCILLHPGDPLLQERFCVVQTPTFGWVGWLGRRTQNEALQFRFSFSPTIVNRCVEILELYAQDSLHRPEVRGIFSQGSAVVPNYRIPERFSRGLLRWMSQFSARQAVADHPAAPRPQDPASLSQVWKGDNRSSRVADVASHLSVALPPTPEKIPHTDLDMELLQALAHELRTPLTTIQTLTRLLLRRSDLPAEAERRIEAIQKECRRQIERFGLMFKAMELTREECHPLPSHLLPTSLQQVFSENLDRWRTQAARRNLTLAVTTPETLPAIAIGDPELLDQVLTGLIEYLSYRSEMGSHLQLAVSLAGDQLKLEFRSNSPLPSNALVHETSMLKAVGQLLMLQTDTGSLSLSLRATKQLFRVLGGKLTVRHHPQGEIVTIFLPIGSS
jgi:signal transduction histidine kinase